MSDNVLSNQHRLRRRRVVVRRLVTTAALQSKRFVGSYRVLEFSLI